MSNLTNPIFYNKNSRYLILVVIFALLSTQLLDKPSFYESAAILKQMEEANSSNETDSEYVLIEQSKSNTNKINQPLSSNHFYIQLIYSKPSFKILFPPPDLFYNC
tara:strand:+ start:21656 stop:21973 length:318 start_codon:yes stop_codon:yes gene_type:complete